MRLLILTSLFVLLLVGCQSRHYSYEAMDPSTGQVVSRVEIDIDNSNVSIGTLKAEKKVDDNTVVSIEVNDLTAEERSYEAFQAAFEALSRFAPVGP